MTDQKTGLGDFLRDIRVRNHWTLLEVSEMTGLAVSTLSKVENNQMSLTYDRLVQLAAGLGVDIVELFGTRPAETAPSLLGRRAISRQGEGRLIQTGNYDYLYLCTEISKKSMVPILAVLHARTMEEFGEFIHHGGQEYTYVIEGALELHTEHYEPAMLKAGDSVYFDASMGHAYLSVSEKPARILCICSTSEKELINSLVGADGEVSNLKKKSKTRGKTGAIRK